MRTRAAGTIVCMVVAMAFSRASAQTARQIKSQERQEATDQNVALQQELLRSVSLTQVNEQNGFVSTPGTAYLVVKKGIHAIPLQNNYYWPNYYFKNGKVHQPLVQASSSSSPDGSTTTMSIGVRIPWQPDGSRRVEENEQVFITQILVSGRTVSYFLQTCTQNVPISRAKIDFHFATKNLTESDLAEVQETVAQLFIDPNLPPPPRQELLANNTPAAQNSADSDSYMVRPGMTQDQVKSMLGDPQKIKREGQGSLFLYDGFAVQFNGNSVTSVSPR